jgi:hypothetical protein
MPYRLHQTIAPKPAHTPVYPAKPLSIIRILFDFHEHPEFGEDDILANKLPAGGLAPKGVDLGGMADLTSIEKWTATSLPVDFGVKEPID